jgi:3-phenylpropionate/trans-cinnamate dioxygenase ferredoxin subunit
MAEFIKVAKVGDIQPGQAKAVKAGSASLALFNVGGKYFALDDCCTHKGAPLSSGMLSGTSITCEWHGATFDLATGTALCAPATEPVKTYTVKVNGDDIEVEVP